MPSIVTITPNPAIDKSCSVDEVVPEQKLRCDAPRFDPGGGGINVSRAIHKLGGESAAIYPAGGHTGNLLKDLLDDEGLDHRPVEAEARTRENLIVLEKSSGKQYRFGMPGNELRERDWKRLMSDVGEVNSDYLVASGSLPPGAPVGFFASLHEHTRAKVIVDTSGEALLKAVEEGGCYLIKPNLRELSQLSGQEKEFETEDEMAEAARGLLDQVDVVFVSMGGEGAMVVTASGVDRIRAPKVEVVSKVGAGDSAVGGLVLMLSRGEDLAKAARFGVAAGASAVMTPGTEICRRDDTERLYEEMLQGKW